MNTQPFQPAPKNINWLCTMVALFLLLAGALAFLSCKKELSCEGCTVNNKPPFANAGPDQTITLPKDSVLLDGSASSDPDGTISSFKWAKIAGLVSLNLAMPDSAKTVAKALTMGVYQFELTVTDHGGLSAKDTIQIIIVNPAINQTPIACAGADQGITLPTNSVILDGTCSSDPDNNITNYLWTKISGPSTFNIANANVVQTTVTNLIQGTYLFELKVTDAGGLSSKDTVQVTVLLTPSSSCEPLDRPVITAQLIPFGNLSIPRSGIATVTAGSKIFFAGGYNSTGYLSRVDIYDMSTQSWSTAELSLPRTSIKAIACGNKVLFASGDGNPNNSRIDIYDLTTQSWSTAELPFAPQPHQTYLLAVASVGNKALFANPVFTQNQWVNSVPVSIYDVTTQSWSTATLSDPRALFNVVTAGDKVYFSGGIPYSDTRASRTIDIYDNSTGTWSTSLLAEPKIFHGSIYKNGKIYRAGGATYGDWVPATDSSNCHVEIKDINTQASTFSNLSQPNYISSAFDINGKLIFLPGNYLSGVNFMKFDVYDVSTNSWIIGVANQMPSYFLGSSWVAANNAIYNAGGVDNCPNSGSSCQYYSQVWKLVF